MERAGGQRCIPVPGAATMAFLHIQSGWRMRNWTGTTHFEPSFSAQQQKSTRSLLKSKQQQ
eukprot:3480002-Amphidinium_carterae.1